MILHALGLLLSLTLAGCSVLDGPVPSEIEPSATPIAESADLLILGAIEPDPLLESGFITVMRQGYELALAEANGIVGGWRIELVSELPAEISTNPTKYGIDESTEIGFGQSAVAFAALDERLVAFLGAHHKYALEDGTIGRICAAGLLMMSPIQTSPSAVKGGCPEQRFFRTSGSASGNGRAAARYLVEESLTRVVVLTAQNDPGRELSAWKIELEAFRAEARRGGLKIIAESNLMNTSAGAIEQLRPDAFVLLGRTEREEAARFWELRSQIRTIPAIVANSAVRDDFEPLGRASTPAGRVVVASAIPIPDGIPGYAALIGRWVERFGAAPPTDDQWLAMNSYAAMKALLVAIERAREAGAMTPLAVRAALPTIVASLALTGAPYELPWGFTGAGERYPTVGGIYLLDFTISEVDGMFPLKTITYE
jgi:hypothetical protein